MEIEIYSIPSYTSLKLTAISSVNFKVNKIDQLNRFIYLIGLVKNIKNLTFDLFQVKDLYLTKYIFY